MKTEHRNPSGLIFDWRGHEGGWLRMLAALLATAALFFGVVMIFRVVTPDARPLEVRPRRVLVLNSEIPAERALIHRAMDRSFPLLAAETARTPSAPAQMSYAPSFQGHELKIRTLSSTPLEEGVQRFFSLDQDILPPLPALEAAPEARARLVVLEVVLEEGLQDRVPGTLTISGVALAEITRPRFRVAVGPRGQVLMALPLVAGDDPATGRKLQEKVADMVFKPSDRPLEWGTVTFRWVEEERS